MAGGDVPGLYECPGFGFNLQIASRDCRKGEEHGNAYRIGDYRGCYSDAFLHFVVITSKPYPKGPCS